MIILSIQLYTSDECHAWFHLDGTSRPIRSASKATKCKMKNSCPQWELKPQPWDPKPDALPTELIGLLWKLYYLNDIYTYMLFQYQCIHWYKFENDEVFCLVNILKGKRNAYSLRRIFVSKIYCLCKWICVWNVKYSYLNTSWYSSLQTKHVRVAREWLKR